MRQIEELITCNASCWELWQGFVTKCKGEPEGQPVLGWMDSFRDEWIKKTALSPGQIRWFFALKQEFQFLFRTALNDNRGSCLFVTLSFLH